MLADAPALADGPLFVALACADADAVEPPDEPPPPAVVVAPAFVVPEPDETFACPDAAGVLALTPAFPDEPFVVVLALADVEAVVEPADAEAPTPVELADAVVCALATGVEAEAETVAPGSPSALATPGQSEPTSPAKTSAAESRAIIERFIDAESKFETESGTPNRGQND